MSKVRIRAGHVRPLWAGHPWVYAQAVAKIEGSPEPGDVVDVVDPHDNWLGAGFFSPNSALAVRVLNRTPGVAIDPAFFRNRVADAIELRTSWLGLPRADTTGYRLVHAEGDRLPGLIVDVYGDVAAVQLLTAGMKRREQQVFDALRELLPLRAIVELPSREHQDHEGFQVEPRVAVGGEVAELAFSERGFEYRLPFAGVQKTGFYFDQRDNRARVEALCHGRRVLDACCYVGAFALAAARGGAREVLALDRSEWALELAKQGFARAGVQVQCERGELKQKLPELIERREKFDVIVLDPPKLAHSTRQSSALARPIKCGTRKR